MRWQSFGLRSGNGKIMGDAVFIDVACDCLSPLRLREDKRSPRIGCKSCLLPCPLWLLPMLKTATEAFAQPTFAGGVVGCGSHIT
jgi:hypothetical protein